MNISGPFPYTVYWYVLMIIFTVDTVMNILQPSGIFTVVSGYFRLKSLMHEADLGFVTVPLLFFVERIFSLVLLGYKNTLML